MISEFNDVLRVACLFLITTWGYFPKAQSYFSVHYSLNLPAK